MRAASADSRGDGTDEQPPERARETIEVCARAGDRGREELHALDARDVRNDAPVGFDARVPLLVATVELVELVPALDQAHGLRRVRSDAVLVPGDVPGNRDQELGVDARERYERSLRLAEALPDAADRPPVLTRVEEVGLLLAERADVYELGSLVGREADDPLAHQERALANRALTGHGCAGDARHRGTSVAEGMAGMLMSFLSYMRFTHKGPRTRFHHGGRWHVRGRIERFAEPALLLLLAERPAHGYELVEPVRSEEHTSELQS